MVPPQDIYNAGKQPEIKGRLVKSTPELISKSAIKLDVIHSIRSPQFTRK